MRLAVPHGLLGAWIVLVCSAAGRPSEVRPQIIWHRDFDIALSEAQLLDRPVLAYVTSKWCPASLRHERSTFFDKQVVKLLGESFVAIQVDADSSPELAQRLGADRLPVSVLLSKDGVVIRRIEGYRPAETYLADLSEATKLYQQPDMANVAKKLPPRQEPTELPTLYAPSPRTDEVELTSHTERSTDVSTETVPTVERHLNLMLDGNCPVTFAEARKLSAGKPEIWIEYDGRTYWFAGADELAKFELDPARYAPAMGGMCVVSHVDKGLKVDGLPRCAAMYQGRLFLFASSEQRRRFQAAPKRYAGCDRTLGGMCPVCRTEHQTMVEGQAEHRINYQGLLYRFDTSEHLRLFLAEPGRYLQTP